MRLNTGAYNYIGSLCLVSLAVVGLSSSANSGIGRVFDPDPVTTLKDSRLKDSSPESVFRRAYKKVVLPSVIKSGAEYILKSEFVELKDLEEPTNAPTTSKDGNFLFSRGEQGFADTMAFYHLDENVRYIHRLGFSGSKNIPHTPIVVDTNGLYGDSGAIYIPDTNQMIFGNGCIDSVEDADEIHRMYFIALMEEVIGELKGGHVSALRHGYADFWAGTRSLMSVGAKNTYRNTEIFQWSSADNCREKRQLVNTGLIYNEGEKYSGNKRIGNGLANQLWTTPLYQSLLELINIGERHEDFDRLVVQSLFEVKSGDKFMDMSLKLLKLARKMYPGRPFYSVLAKHFQVHKLRPFADIQYTIKGQWRGGVASQGVPVYIDFQLANQGTIDSKNTKISLVSSDANIEIINNSPTVSAIPKGSSLNLNGQVGFKIKSGTNCISAKLKLILETTDTLETHKKEIEFPVYTLKEETITSTTPINIEYRKWVSTEQEFSNSAIETAETIELSVNFDHQNPTYLAIDLLHPNGTAVRVWHFGYSKVLKGRFPVTLTPYSSLDRFNKRNPNGKWRLKIYERYSGNNGKLNSWAVHAKMKCN